MGRVMALDVGGKRTGVAVTDPMKIISTPLETVPTSEVFEFLKNYQEHETIEVLVIGLPKKLDNTATDATPIVERFVAQLEKSFPDLPFKLIDERFTSKMALNAMIAAGSKKKDRRVKGNIDKISASIILQSYLEQQ